ncbi:MAG: 2-oxoglutarate and iron-dependent oxygenase domain-containing protein [Bacteroidia bacterium]|nr:isopenicillin N synthase family oxygenase [Bacteroidia bacterium]MDW8015009.1 2-oxoglutarate and iron-dependent oxygenase domain-containing protein [Bacteroidia bacterium]
MENLPLLDLKAFIQGGEAQRLRFVKALGEAFTQIGFAIIENHLVPEALQKQIYEKTKAFFDLPLEIKRKYVVPGTSGQRGYTPPNQEHAKGQKVPDLKEFFHIGPEVEPSIASAQNLLLNVWPEEVPGFRQTFMEAYEKFFETGRVLLQALALYLELEEDYFEPRVQYGPSLLRLLHYYPLEKVDIPPGATRAAEHEDINLITLLIGASAEGLEVLTREGKWLAPVVAPHQMVVNVGDMLQRLTNNKLRSTTHRVTLPPPEKRHLSRYSVPFFLHPRPEVSLACLPSCIDEAHPKAYPDITAGEYLNERLVELRLKQ